MGNCILAYPNRGDECTLSGGSWSTSLPLVNLQNRRIARTARTADAVDGSFTVAGDFGKLRPVKLVALVNHNFTTGARFRFRMYSDAGLTSLQYDSGEQDVFRVLFSEVSEDWDSGNFWDLTLSAEEREGLTATLVLVLDQQITDRYWKLEVMDSGNPTDYLQAGRLFVGPAWTPVINMDTGASLGYESRDLIDESIGGAEFFEERPAPRVARFSLPYMEDSEGWQVAFDLMRKQLTTRDVFYMWDQDDVINVLRRSFLGRLRQLSPIEVPYFDKTATAFEIKEQI